VPRITKRFVDSLKPDRMGGDIFAWDAGDGALKGFGVRMKPSGSAAFILQYRTREGRTRRLALGRVGTLTPEQARAFAREKLADVAKGGDPSAERRRFREAITVAELCDLHLKEATGRVKASTLAMDRSRIETHVKPLIGRYAVSSLTPEDIERLQIEISTGRSAKPRKGSRGGAAKGGRGVAARTIGMFSTILETARRRGVIPDNPARGVRRFTEGRQRRFLSLEEIAALGKALQEAEKDGERPSALDVIRLLLLTGLRRMEGLALRRAWIDTRAKCIRFEDTKSGAQLRPIGSAAVALLEGIPTCPGSPWVFPGYRGEGHLVGLPKVLGRICARAGLEGVTLHVLRHTFAAVAAEMGFSELTIAGLLGHSVPGVTARYAHVPDTALVAAADRVSSRIAEVLTGHLWEPRVVPLHRGERGAR
jgi:integrase